MCMFSGPVRYVGSTRIFARPLDGGRQALAYEMKVAQDRDLAMILPLPTPDGVAEDAVQFLDLSNEKDLFGRLDALFPARLAYGGMPSRGGIQPQALTVHRVGSFNASFVPRLADFARLDEVFRLPPQVWDQLPQYAAHSFCVFALRPPESDKPGLLGRLFGSAPEAAPHDIHPMAFVFPRRNPRELFFPTVHVHDGEVHATAHFDHSLFLQGAPSQSGWETSASPAPRLMGDAQILTDSTRPVQRRVLLGTLPNQDTVVAL